MPSQPIRPARLSAYEEVARVQQEYANMVTERDQALQNSYTVSSNDSIRFYYGEPLERPTMASRKKEDALALKQFIENGTSGVIGAYLSEDGKLGVYGVELYDSRLIFVIDGNTLYARTKRTTHLTAILNRLARQEDLTIVFSDDDPEIDTSIPVIYYAFKNREEVDDSDLVAQNEPRLDGMVLDPIEASAEMPSVYASSLLTDLPF